MNPYMPDHIGVQFGNLKYNGVREVSTKFIINAYPNDNPFLINPLFATIGVDKVIFDKFIYQILIYNNGEKITTLKIINSLCGNSVLSNRVYDGYAKEYPKQMEFFRRIRIEQKRQEDTETAKYTFSVPIKTDDFNGITFKHKNITEIIFISKGVQFKNRGGNQGIDAETEFQIIIEGSAMNLKSRYLDGYLIESYLIDSSSIDSTNQAQILYLNDEAKVKKKK